MVLRDTRNENHNPRCIATSKSQLPPTVCKSNSSTNNLKRQLLTCNKTWENTFYLVNKQCQMNIFHNSFYI